MAPLLLTTETAVLVVAVLALLALVAGVAALVRDRRRLTDELSRTRAERDGLAAERDRADRRARGLEQALGRERLLLRRLRDSWQAERAWSRELRSQLQAAHRARPADTGSGGVPELILEAAIQLVEADRGLLLARADEDHDGDLDLVAAHGFRHDPEHSAVVQRFAREVLERDEIVREDDPPRDAERRTPADDEIDTLVAIPLYLRDRFHGVIVCANREGGFEHVDDEVLVALGDHAGVELQHGRLRHELGEGRRATVRTLAEALAARDPILHRESGRLAVLAGRLGRRLGFDERETDVLVCATLLRAVGYLALPERPLAKPAPLTPHERGLVELHPRLGFNILAQAPHLRDVAVTVLYHHERVDGAGYPAGLAGDSIPRTARALAVLEAFGAMTHERPFRAGCGAGEACAELIAHAGSQFDREIVDAFVELARDAGDLEEPALDALLDVLPFEPGANGGLLGRFTASAVDGLTMLGNHRALVDAVRDAAEDASEDHGFAVAMLELEDLPRVNREESFVAGDRLVQVTGRAAQRAALRVGGAAYRDSGRRFAVVAPLGPGEDPDTVLDVVRSEFALGPSVRTIACRGEPGEPADEVLGRVRGALRAS